MSGLKSPETVHLRKPATYIADPLRAVPALVFFVILAAVAVVLLTTERIWGGVVFLAIAGFCFYQLMLYGAIFHVDENGVRESFFGLNRHAYRWEELREWGVAGTRLFNNGAKPRGGSLETSFRPEKDGKHVGVLYIYFSDEAMDDEGRFDMLLKWPDRRRIFLWFTHRRFAAVQSWLDTPAVGYNIGKLDL